MLCLTRVEEDTILIGPEVTIRFLRVERGKVLVGIEAPRRLTVLRGELAGDRANEKAAGKRPVKMAV